MSKFASLRVFTTGQVSKICQVAPRTVTKWFDSGQLAGYRIPGSNDRRIPRENLIRFMQSHGMPLDAIAEPQRTKILLVGLPDVEPVALVRQLPVGGFEVEGCRSGFQAGARSAAWKPDCVVLDTDTEEGLVIAGALRETLPEHPPQLIGIASRDAAEVPESSMFSDWMRRPFDLQLLAARLCDLARQRPSLAGTL